MDRLVSLLIGRSNGLNGCLVDLLIYSLNRLLAGWLIDLPVGILISLLIDVCLDLLIIICARTTIVG